MMKLKQYGIRRCNTQRGPSKRVESLLRRDAAMTLTDDYQEIIPFTLCDSTQTRLTVRQSFSSVVIETRDGLLTHLSRAEAIAFSAWLRAFLEETRP